MSTFDAVNSLPDGLISFGPDTNCTLELCPIEVTLLGYRPSLPASSIFIGLFSAILLVHVVLGIWKRTIGYTSSVACGCILEIAGYAGRVILYDDPFDFNGFIMQIVCITIAPLFFCAAIYVLLSQVVIQVDPSLSRFKPSLFYWIFIPCDIVSLILQATGGALSCLASTQEDVDIGVKISLAGLVFQVVCITFFCGFFADYLVLCKKSGAKINQKLKFFLIFLLLSIVFILIRCVYRIVELREGYFSEMFRDEPPFIALESGIMVAAVLCMAIGHPGFALKTPQRVKTARSEETSSASEESKN
ncbi:RTA1 like protein-domain-containing protein [Plectosphaerella plurivora]|uniref:RTA1 like protein-domain-containing protein n=1 Tax=Plectosphaerella plurivora TaxID=936078 RepID=A0A9P8V4N0_9PEZI|nr:RTA1 like protein-domain-containing protein [Plectosphaerella plurivora]